jgi:3-oxoacyl-[acyl-carrier protein] reductase
MEITFNGKAVLVTGAARGIGRAIALGFAREGAYVVATDVNAQALAELAAACPAGAQLQTRLLDVTDRAALASVVNDITTLHTQVDVLVHVAGGVMGQSAKPMEEVSEQDWDAIQSVNLSGAFFAAQAVVPGMKRAGAGRIVVIASGAAFGVSLTGIQSYATAKAAQMGLVRQLAHELGQYGITVNGVAPGFLRTSPDYERQWASYGEEGQKALLERVAMRRLGEPADIADAVLFLASSHASFITGQTLPVTGSPVGR